MWSPPALSCVIIWRSSEYRLMLGFASAIFTDSPAKKSIFIFMCLTNRGKNVAYYNTCDLLSARAKFGDSVFRTLIQTYRHNNTYLHTNTLAPLKYILCV